MEFLLEIVRVAPAPVILLLSWWIWRLMNDVKKLEDRLDQHKLEDVKAHEEVKLEVATHYVKTEALENLRHDMDRRFDKIDYKLDDLNGFLRRKDI